MTEQDEARRYADLEQQFGPEYKFADHRRGETITYTAFDGETRSGVIIWIQEPGIAYGRDEKRIMRAQYVVDSGRGMPDFVDFSAVQTGPLE